MNSINTAWLIRRHAIEMTHLSGGSHIASILSVADIISVLYSDVMHYDVSDPKSEDRDRFILSKGHAGGAVYAALAESGFFNPEELKTHYQNGSRLSGHVSHHIPGVDFSTGSLGHGLSVGVGMAVAAKQDNKNHRVFVVLGDGECNEGSVWEAAQVAAHFNLNNLIAIVDSNKMQSLDYAVNTLNSGKLFDKWKAFGWNAIETDGHDHESLSSVLNTHYDVPTVIIANTIKGKGISFMEENILWHYRFPHEGDEYSQAVSELLAAKPNDVHNPYNDTISSKIEIKTDDSKHLLSETYHPTWYSKEV